MNLKNIRKIVNISKPQVMGNKLLILATAPDANRFFEKENIREYFAEYDLAFLNKMPLCSSDELYRFKPKYIIFMDGIFYEDDFDGKGKGNERKDWVERILKGIDWECYIVTPCLAEFDVNNEHLHYIGLSPISVKYNRFFNSLYKKNIINTGLNNVVFGSLYFGVTFGYKEIGIMGFPYRPVYSYMDTDGYHVEGYAHYYDLDVHTKVISFENIFTGKESFMLKAAKRIVSSNKQLCNLALYAKENDVNIINYTENSCVDVFIHKHIE